MNEPVAWHYPGGSPEQCTTNKEYAEMDPPWTPMYAEPKLKELTDEEINLLAKAYSTMEGELNAPAFARAILRKAQEK